MSRRTKNSMSTLSEADVENFVAELSSTDNDKEHVCPTEMSDHKNEDDSETSQRKLNEHMVNVIDETEGKAEAEVNTKRLNSDVYKSYEEEIAKIMTIINHMKSKHDEDNRNAIARELASEAKIKTLQDVNNTMAAEIAYLNHTVSELTTDNGNIKIILDIKQNEWIKASGKPSTPKENGKKLPSTKTLNSFEVLVDENDENISSSELASTEKSKDNINSQILDYRSTNNSKFQNLKTNQKSQAHGHINKKKNQVLSQKDRLKRKAIITNLEIDWLNYKTARNKVNIQLKNAKKDYYSTKIAGQKHNPKEAWKTINNILGRQSKPTVANELKVGENILTNTQDIAEGFNDYFSNIGPDLASKIDSTNFNYETYVENAKSEFAAFQPVTVQNVYQLLHCLCSNKATGVDKISCKIIKIAAPVISDSLTYIFNQAITLSIFPDEWKTARVIPLYKNGQRNMPGNYRPISVLPTISKIMERILYDQLYDYFTKFGHLSDCQFGFRKFHSTTTALLDCTNEWYMNLDRKKFNLVILIDLKKAFDTVDHQILLKKLELYGVKGQALSFVQSYISNRKQKCQIQNSLSSEKLIKCGVPQGSILGPLFFLLYINDLPQCLYKTKPRLFADDTNLTASGDSITDLEAAVNSDLENLRKWLIANKLSLNVAKTEFMLIGSKQMIRSISDLQLNVKIENESVKQVHESITLGVTIDQHLSWKSNTENICKKITSGISALRRLKEFADKQALLSVYNAIVRPYFDYCCEVWDVFVIPLPVPP
ncbi:Hypothetical predicted protein [Paramuricea clavata]|uniref:Uncharacterized protein n=1 Tax=Paramuricea clavata TaxID=317549 RepID=A0A6S7H466_PARCT|nr:Hypothetical predicted protein [Paramuricea clavata]